MNRRRHVLIADATLLAIEEISTAHRVLGRLEPVVVDGQSDGPAFARGVQQLIVQERVSVVFGCWTSASRKTVKPVFEQHNHLLLCPVQYEGLEQSPNTVYTGAAPNQQIVPAVKWCLDRLGRRFFLVASDHVFPRAANEVIRDQVTALRGEIVGEEYIPLGSHEVGRAVRAIVAQQPDVILNTINGDTHVAFFAALRQAGITPERIPTMSFSIAEDELRTLGCQRMVGDYACWNHFQSIDTPENRRYVAGFQARHGPDRSTDDPLEAAYFGGELWAQAATEAGTDEVGAVRAALPDQSLLAPEGLVHVDADSNRTWKTVRIGRIRADGQFTIVWSSQTAIRPVPHPSYRSQSDWDAFLRGLHEGWGRQWAAPATRGRGGAGTSPEGAPL